MTGLGKKHKPEKEEEVNLLNGIMHRPGARYFTHIPLVSQIPFTTGIILLLWSKQTQKSTWQGAELGFEYLSVWL